MNTDNGHIYIQIEMSPNIAVSSAVQKLKQRSSIDLKKVI
jgi:REP element-mobilizing transposase RayT